MYDNPIDIMIEEEDTRVGDYLDDWLGEQLWKHQIYMKSMKDYLGSQSQFKVGSMKQSRYQIVVVVWKKKRKLQNENIPDKRKEYKIIVAWIEEKVNG